MSSSKMPKGPAENLGIFDLAQPWGHGSSRIDRRDRNARALWIKVVQRTQRPPRRKLVWPGV